MAHRNLASERVRIGYTQVEMARELGIAASTLVKYENDITSAPVELVRKAAAIFGCTTDYLLDMTNERTI